ncbi:hypothetical protein [Aureivirga sp. CE67]|uniref:hypothetical protein n=1 Tax=Aureivirga sp. CE67 TaxID=1788983 RepID=UPI0018C96A82|nr:hypothetical protein [Aureivirga sp. CE67]
MKNKYLNIPLYIGILIAVFGGVLSLFSENYLFPKIMHGGLWIFEIYGILLLLWKGTLRKTRYFWFIITSFLILGAGVFLKIKFENPYVIPIGVLGIIISYLLHFNKKKEKKLLDIFKLIWVIVSYSTIGGVFLFDLPKDAMFYANMTLWITLLIYLKQNHKISE